MSPGNTTTETYEVIAVRYGTRQTRRSAVYLNYHLYDEPDGPIGMDYYFWVIRNDRRTIVVDTGYGELGSTRRDRTFLIHPEHALRELGVVPNECTVVLTHAHYDHAGNLGLFPDTPVYLARSEFEFWTGAYGTRLQYHHSVENADIDRLRRIHHEERLNLVEQSHDIAPGVRLIELGGHSPGQAVLTVDTADGAVLLASDATHYYEELERDMPFFVVDDLKAMYAGFDALKAMTAELDAVLVPGHDPDVAHRHPAIPGVLGGLAHPIGRPVAVPATTHERKP